MSYHGDSTATVCPVLVENFMERLEQLHRSTARPDYGLTPEERSRLMASGAMKILPQNRLSERGIRKIKSSRSLVKQAVAELIAAYGEIIPPGMMLAKADEHRLQVNTLHNAFSIMRMRKAAADKARASA